MDIINKSKELNINNDEKYLVDSNEDLALIINCHHDANIFFNIKKINNMDIKCYLDKDIKVSIFYHNDSDHEINTNENYEVKENSELVISYSEFNYATTNRNSHISLNEISSRGVINSASLVNANKNYNLIVENKAKYTMGELNNYAVVLKDGRLMIDAIGKINNGAKKAESHQTSRALSFGETQKTTILPELLIDENDVKASHAMSIGRMDEDKLYYLMSRGLSFEDCTSLVSIGYLYPIFDNIKDEELKNSLKDALERKLENI